MDDNQIIDLYWERSEFAINETSKKYGRYCNQIAINILANHEDTEECVNDTYLRAWNSMPENRPLFLSSFLGKITRNLALNKYKRRKADKRGGGEVELILHELEECITSDNSIEDTLETDRLAKIISNFLRTLNTDNMTVFVRRYWYSDSITLISKQFGISESKVKSILFRCRAKLKTYLESEDISL